MEHGKDYVTGADYKEVMLKVVDKINFLEEQNAHLQEQLGYFNNYKTTIEKCVETLAETRTGFESNHIGDRRFGGICDLENLCEEYRLMRRWDEEGDIHETGKQFWEQQIIEECEKYYGDGLNWNDFDFVGFEKFIAWLVENKMNLEEAYEYCAKELVEDEDFINWEDSEYGKTFKNDPNLILSTIFN